ncbi:LacI family DNA-binding transcriptional regulator [Alginatibacterium sediminis]|uniref:Ribose operon repressor n=1 Tax=Alginatibacterium sediminis TaxID=2164068 RepID=A0A420E6V7_9ALTE|nr:substrate-binding domain-containing protein [Alginatibacterium sediminis]RKF13658.1 LacI family DNA-binding transcriptional regulator [Alginatibacterium sediminis]
MASMKDVAKLAVVSTSTVSHVINKSRYVSEEITERVLKAAKQLNYSPSALARSLKTNRTRTIGLLLTTSTNPFFAEVVKGVERRCYEQNYNLILCNSEGDETRMKASVNTLLERRVDGLILLCSTLEGQHLDVFDCYKDIPTVVMDWGDTHFPSDKIKDNSHLGGYMATQYLIEHGHKKIACITGPLDRQQAQQRFNGFKQALKEAGLALQQQWIIPSNFECDGGYEAFNTLLASSELPSAIFVCNDMMAMGVINAAHKKGIRVPEDISLIGYDDVDIAKYMVPALTTIHQPKFRLGSTAVDTLLKRIENKDALLKQVQLEPTLVIRNSVKTI